MNIGGYACRACKNWRTTLAGVAAIMAALADLLTQVSTKGWDMERLGADVTGIATGVGLILSRDSAVSEEEHHEDRVRIHANREEISEVKADAVVAKAEAVVAKAEAVTTREMVEKKL